MAWLFESSGRRTRSWGTVGRTAISVKSYTSKTGIEVKITVGLGTLITQDRTVINIVIISIGVINHHFHYHCYDHCQSHLISISNSINLFAVTIIIFIVIIVNVMIIFIDSFIVVLVAAVILITSLLKKCYRYHQ